MLWLRVIPIILNHYNCMYEPLGLSPNHIKLYSNERILYALIITDTIIIQKTFGNGIFAIKCQF